MKKIIKVLGVILFSVFLLVPLKTNAQEADWIQKLELGDSVSSSIVKVEDGVIVMQYEGAASANNLLIKYDFNGKKLWEIDNDYGYNIESVSDGFIVWSEEKITKFDKDKNILWSKDIELKDSTVDYYENVGPVGLGNKLIELSDRYIICQTFIGNNRHNDIFSIDFSGNIINRLSAADFFSNNNISITTGNNYDKPQLIAIGKAIDNNKIIVGYKKYNSSPFYIAEMSNDFRISQQKEYSSDLIPYKAFLHWSNGIIKIVETDKGYITIGMQMLYFLKDGKVKQFDNEVLDVIKSSNNIYTYEFEKNEDNYVNMYDTYLVKYDTNFKIQKKIRLPLMLNSNWINSSIQSGFSQIKSRIIVTDESHCITLNTPIHSNRMTHVSNGRQVWAYESHANSYEIESDKYTLTSYKLTESNENNNSGIINNIIKNPQTNSITIISIFVLLILVISIVSYRIYKKKNRKTDK